MMLHPPVMALLMVALISATALGACGWFARGLLRHWNPALGTARQITLERRTQLVGTVVAMLLLLQGFALVLMVYNADRSAPLLVGAMCAFGSFNASVYGFPALYAKIALFFGAGIWLAIHHADMDARDYPLTVRKYGLLLALVPLAWADAALTLAYFVDLQPDTLTSCCGSTFHPEHEGIAAHASAVSPPAALTLLYTTLAGLLALGWSAGRHRALALAYGVASPAFFAVALLAVVAAIGPYAYESPNHHCPFCLLKREYGYLGFALYLPLFAATSAGLASGALSLRASGAATQVPPARVAARRRVSMAGYALFGLLCAAVVCLSGLRM